MLEIINLKKTYGAKAVLQGVTLSVAQGQIMSLLGANGAGKTTLASIVAGLRTADGGEVWVSGLDALARTRSVRKLVGLAPQELGIYPTLSVAENLRFFGRLCGLSGQKLNKRIQEVAEALSLKEILLQTVGTLSGGQKRRLHTGTALLHCPPLLFLDEPTVGADVCTRAEILRAVRSVAAQGTAVVYSTHCLQEVESLGGSVCILESGRILTQGSVESLVSAYGTPSVEFTFEGPPPKLPLISEEMLQIGNHLRIQTRNPQGVIAQVLNQVRKGTGAIRNMEVVRPSLEGVYLHLTGRRYTASAVSETAPSIDSEKEKNS